MLLALIREAECVGCAKCLPACPVDAIIGAPKFLHTIIANECIGCGLCVAPCPMDCIEMVESPLLMDTPQKTTLAEKAKSRYIAKKNRLILNEQPKLPILSDPQEQLKIQQEIKDSILRVNEKRQLHEFQKKP